jgi:hypothetical protein
MSKLLGIALLIALAACSEPTSPPPFSMAGGCRGRTIDFGGSEGGAATPREALAAFIRASDELPDDAMAYDEWPDPEGGRVEYRAETDELRARIIVMNYAVDGGDAWIADEEMICEQVP